MTTESWTILYSLVYICKFSPIDHFFVFNLFNDSMIDIIPILKESLFCDDYVFACVHVKCILSHVKCILSHVKCILSHVKCILSHIALLFR